MHTHTHTHSYYNNIVMHIPNLKAALTTTTTYVKKKLVRGKLRDTARHFRIIEQYAALLPLVPFPPTSSTSFMMIYNI